VDTTDRIPVHRDLSRIPARSAAGVRGVLTEAGRVVNEMDVPRWLTDATGTVVPGALAILADSALGSAVMSTVPLGRSMVTTYLHLQLVRAVGLDVSTLRADGRQAWLGAGSGIGEGDITDADGMLVAKASIGSLLLDQARPDGPPLLPVDARLEGSSHPLLAGAPVHGVLRTEVVQASRDGVRVVVPAQPALANSSGGVHGGAGVLFGERAIDLALRAGDPDRAPRPVELRASFLRRIDADGRPIECRATIVHRGRRLVAGRCEVYDHRGRVAVEVELTYLFE
jgi:uncharacterized protein (TIGR00369 family)